jgi:hypothetical protein
MTVLVIKHSNAGNAAIGKCNFVIQMPFMDVVQVKKGATRERSSSLTACQWIKLMHLHVACCFQMKLLY